MAVSGFGESLEEGWFPVEKVRQGPEQGEEDDPSIWVLFLKGLGDEKFQVRLPEVPVYRYLDEGVFEVTSQRDGEVFQLTVRENGDERGGRSYLSEGKWVHEHFVKTAGHFYHFKTVSDQSDSAHHKEFISSFFIEKNS